MNTIFKVISGWWLVVRSRRATRVSKGERGDSRFRGNDNAIQNCFQGEAIVQRRECVILSEVEGLYKRFLSSLVWILSSVILAACDFHGPWEYYPDEREVYTGIYTYGYIVADERPEVCFSKVYELEETSAEHFAFYKSANVTLSGRFGGEIGKGEERTVSLTPYTNNPGCFYSPNSGYFVSDSGVGAYYSVGYSFSGMQKFAFTGIEGETYTLEATFKWDSAGHDVQSTYRATATIPKAVKIKGFNIPKQDGSFEWVEYYNGKTIEMDFLEYPMDMEFVRVALDYDHSVRGVLSIMNYSSKNGESKNTTINKMFEGVTNEDDKGYRGIAMHDALETQLNLGYAANYTIGGIKNLDTLHLTNMMLPLGEFSVDMYATDDAYIDYVDKVKQSVSDSRVIPVSNIENGMGVFSGMARTRVYMDVHYSEGSWVSLGHIADRHCLNEEGDNSDSWDSKGCRLYLDIYCSGDGPSSDLARDNKNAYRYYSRGRYLEIDEACYPSDVKAAMMQANEDGWEIEKWSVYLPDTISAEQKSKAYADGLKRYCVASNFVNNKLANCNSLKAECLDSPEKTNCKEYLWQWCADRDWDYNEYPQCGPAMVSRYLVENIKSSIWEKEVKKWCEDSCNEEYALCEELGYKHENGKVCIEPMTLVIGGTNVVY